MVDSSINSTGSIDSYRTIGSPEQRHEFMTGLMKLSLSLDGSSEHGEAPILQFGMAKNGQTPRRKSKNSITARGA